MVNKKKFFYAFFYTQKPTTTSAKFTYTTKAILESTTAGLPPTTTSKSFSTSTREPICYPGSLDPRCVQLTTKNIFPTFTTTKAVPTISIVNKTPSPFTTTSKSFSTAANKPVLCYLGSSDPRCKQTVTSRVDQNTKVEVEPDTIQEQTTEKLAPIETTTPQKPISIYTTSKVTKPAITYTTAAVTTNRPASSTQQNFEFTTTKKVPIYPTYTGKPIISSPQPFNTRQPFTTTTTTTTTENPVCYPGSTIPGCKSTFTTPAFCYPGTLK